MKPIKKFFKHIFGTAILEFAFVFPVFLLFIFGIFEFGFIMWYDSSMNYAATSGSRYAFVYPTAAPSTIENYAMSKISVPPNTIVLKVTKGTDTVDIDGTLTYTFIILPFSPLTITTHIHQITPVI